MHRQDLTPKPSGMLPRPLHIYVLTRVLFLCPTKLLDLVGFAPARAENFSPRREYFPFQLGVGRGPTKRQAVAAFSERSFYRSQVLLLTSLIGVKRRPCVQEHPRRCDLVLTLDQMHRQLGRADPNAVRRYPLTSIRAP